MNKTTIPTLLASIIIGACLLFYFDPSGKFKSVIPQEPQAEQVVPETPQPKPSTFQESLSAINKEEMGKQLFYLASKQLEGRMSGKQGNIVAAEFVKKEYESYGLPTMYDKFNIDRVNAGPNNEKGNNFTQNIYAWIEGTDLKNEIVVVGAHMDHIGYGPTYSRSRQIAVHPGADDNASGTVALLAMAKAMAAQKPRRTIVFQSYSAEEMGLLGSRHYVSHAKFPLNAPSINKHVAMVNLDMVGYLGKGIWLAGFDTRRESSIDLGKEVRKLSTKYNFASKISSRGTGGSDHASFYNARIPVVFLHTGLHDYYHTPQDTADKINYDGLEQVTKYCCELVWNIANRVDKPEFYNSGFIPMTYDHDHGHGLEHNH